MNRYLFCLVNCIIAFTTVVSQAQIQTVRYSPDAAYLNEKQPLPAETNWQLSGPLIGGAQLVELAIFDLKADRRDQPDPLHRATFRQPLGYSLPEFSIPVNYLLRANQQYDLDLRFFGPIDSRDRAQLVDRLTKRALTYLQLQTEGDRTGLKFAASPKRILRELNEVLTEELQYYRNDQGQFQPLENAELLKLHLEYVDKANSRKDSLNQTNRTLFLGAPTTDLVTTLREELDLLLGQTVFRQLDARYFDDYPTERKRGFLSLQVGYAGVYLDEDFDNDFYYDGAPFAGFSVPLGNASFAPRLLSNASFSVGVLLTELDDEAGAPVDGPLVNLPVYGSFDYKLFDFLRLNAGVVLLEGNRYNREGQVTNDQQIFLRPFVGLSARIDLGIRLGR